MVFIPKPNDRESLLIFGDGDESIFGGIWNSNEQGYMLIHFRPLKKMIWKHQIQPKEYDSHDRWIKKIYKKDLCHQLSFDPDFPVWVVLCDYDGNEDTALFRLHEELIRKNRDLDKNVKQKDLQISMMRMNMRKKIERPEEAFLDMVDKVSRFKKAYGEVGMPPGYAPEQQQQGQEG